MNRKSELNNLQKKFILLQFTKELIHHSSEGEVSELKNILEEKSKKREEKFREEKELTVDESKTPEKDSFEEYIKSKVQTSSSIAQAWPIESKVRVKFRPSNQPIKRMSLSPMMIPQSRLPPRFQYLKPTPTKLEIDLGKLNSLIKDPLVKNIECLGPNQKIIVSGMMGRRKTDIALSRDEIEQIIKKFSETAKIPVHEGVFKVVVGKLVFSAVISNIIGSKFIIRKMIYNPGFK